MRPVCFAVLLTASGSTFAQGTNEAYPKIEVFGGFSADKFFYSESSGEAGNPNVSVASLFDFGADQHKGFDVSAARNFTRYLGIKADSSMYFRQDSGMTSDGQAYRVPERTVLFMVGPEIKARNHTRLAPFAHALFGFAHSSANFTIDASTIQSHSREGFAMALGGGLDFRMARRFSIRFVTDYSATHLGNPSPDDSGRQNHIRFALGVLFHIR
jgi:hypothetical protein